MIINVKNLTKKFGNVVAVDNVSFGINKNKIFALLGLNGAGKTTLIKMLTCLTKPTSGDAIILNESILKNSVKIKEQINISPQETAIALNLTVLENLMFIAEIYGLDKVTAKQKCLHMIELFKLTEKKNVLSKNLSGGMQRRLGIALALISSPKILFLDEPTLGLDVIARRELWKILIELKKSTTIILTTHYLDEVENLADEVGIMKDGKIIEIGTVKDIVDKVNAKNFEEAFITLSEKENLIWKN